MDIEEMLKLDNQLCFAAYTLSRDITGIYRPLLEELGLTYTQYITMLVLWEEGDVTVKQLGYRLRLDSGTLTPLLKKLVASGIVEKNRDPDDERSVIVRLTPKGIALRSRVLAVPEKVFCATHLTLEELTSLRSRMKALSQAIIDSRGDASGEGSGEAD